ncbi:zinc finger protein 570 [Microplitis mediator]|uniref:zinc finger protein 570 n=1 Tax=Microplitis mediator TaxID=375433 RepID=UPI00255635AA|nr:zinc finger protein 570 [Microplitis mediator]
MESGAIGIGRLDCYEDMFKEITRKLYGDDPDHRTSSVQNEFEASVSYKNEDDNGANDSDDGNWTCEDEPLKGTDGSRIAAYNPGKATWRCYECGDCLTGSPRDVAEHFMELHSSRLLDDARHHRDHGSRKDYLHSDPKLEDILSYLEKVRDKAERVSPPSRRTQETQTIPAALLPATSNFLLQELPSTPPQHLHSSPTMMTSSATNLSSSKRYTCPYCPYGTDRRDLYTRHENIHREEKPFHCYVCYKPFNRADHVKKHFLRMHREHTYELSRIRRSPGSSDAKPPLMQDNAANTTANQINGNNQNSYTNYNNNKNYQLPTSQPPTTNPVTAVYQNSMAVGNIQDANCGNRRIQPTGCNSKSHLKAGSKGAERRYTCCYCSWSGVDNWCLKRHLNTHLKPFACSLCEYKAARAERLATHVLKVHNKRQCSRCSFLGEDSAQLQLHQLHVHRINNGSPGNANIVNNTSVGTTSTAQTSLQTSSTTPCRTDPIHLSGGRPPPGPPVFPTQSTIVPPPTTILGMTNGRNKRKQRAPRKIVKRSDLKQEQGLKQTDEEQENCFNDNDEDETINDNINNKTNCLNTRSFRCYLCPNNAHARALSTKPYHTKASLTLHRLWRHSQNNNNINRKMVVDMFKNKQSTAQSIMM